MGKWYTGPTFINGTHIKEKFFRVIMNDNTIDYKDSLNLPQTGFPMKASLSQREPDILKKWDAIELYNVIQAKSLDKPTFILNDGPPYANGSIHLGHALNKILKDIIVKSKRLSGFNAPFVPGWDCHGLPIELNVEKKIGKPNVKVDATTFRNACREYAETQIQAQKESFKRLGVLGDWENPYRTMSFDYEANTVRALSKIIQNNHVQQGFKPVHWCIDCGSALAEAEVIYLDKTSPTIYVGFAVQEVADKFTKSLQDAQFVIWTTTPWTLPANQAVAVNGQYLYAVLEVETALGPKKYVVADGLKENFLNAIGISIEAVKVLDTIIGKELEGIMLQHPFYDRTVPIILGDHVTLDAGTGCVHTAPAHGQEDYVVGLQYALNSESPVAGNGCFIASTPLLAGEHVFKANNKIIKILEEAGFLLKQDVVQHSYPHCWRHKSPIIFRATPQWFISMDHAGLREKALQAIKTVEWLPTWGEARITGMIESHPGWCISRQRTWGVPLCLFLHKETGALHPDTAALHEKVAQRIEQHGINAWYDIDVQELLREDAAHYSKSLDTLDVWFESGVVHACVLDANKALHSPADLYLEGSDQHRGWFQSSLLTSIAMKGVAPYKTVLTHGFTVDVKGHKFSKSAGNGVAPEKIINSLGADVLRLWVAATDYRTDVTVSDEIFNRMSDAYRRIRNTMRFLLGNLHEFTPNEHCISVDAMLELDKWIIYQTALLQEEIILAYNDYQFHLIFHKIHNFCVNELGSFYLDIIKDRLYTAKTEGLPRRSAQTALYYLSEYLVRWLSPILSFTAEEIWEYMPGERTKSVFLSTWFHAPVVQLQMPFTAEYWQNIILFRNCVNKVLEGARNTAIIGSSLEADLEIYADATWQALLKNLKFELSFVVLTSRVSLHAVESKPSNALPTEIAGIWLSIKSFQAEKCERCWNRSESVHKNAQHPNICARCITNVTGEGEQRSYA